MRPVVFFPWPPESRPNRVVGQAGPWACASSTTTSPATLRATCTASGVQAAPARRGSQSPSSMSGTPAQCRPWCPRTALALSVRVRGSWLLWSKFLIFTSSILLASTTYQTVPHIFTHLHTNGVCKAVAEYAPVFVCLCLCLLFRGMPCVGHCRRLAPSLAQCMRQAKQPVPPELDLYARTPRTRLLQKVGEPLPPGEGGWMGGWAMLKNGFYFLPLSLSSPNRCWVGG